MGCMYNNDVICVHVITPEGAPQSSVGESDRDTRSTGGPRGAMLEKLLRVTVIVMQFLIVSGRCLAVGALGLLLAAQCQNPAALTTGLTGTVTRGPITPVCRPDVPCDAPMQASFDVRRGGRTV